MTRKGSILQNTLPHKPEFHISASRLLIKSENDRSTQLTASRSLMPHDRDANAELFPRAEFAGA